MQLYVIKEREEKETDKREEQKIVRRERERERWEKRKEKEIRMETEGNETEKIGE